MVGVRLGACEIAVLLQVAIPWMTIFKYKTLAGRSDIDRLATTAPTREKSSSLVTVRTSQQRAISKRNSSPAKLAVIAAQMLLMQLMRPRTCFRGGCLSLWLTELGMSVSSRTATLNCFQGSLIAMGSTFVAVVRIREPRCVEQPTAYQSKEGARLFASYSHPSTMGMPERNFSQIELKGEEVGGGGRRTCLAEGFVDADTLAVDRRASS